MLSRMLPTSILGAQYSVPYALAVTLVREMSNPLVFGVDVLEDPEIRGLAAKIEAHEGNERFADDHHGYVSEITLEFNGTSVRLLADGFPGSLAQPLDFAGITEKFTRFATPVIGPAPTAAIVERVADLEHLGDVGELAALLRTPQVAGGRAKRARATQG
jgi:2-methylcitrate dehydratase PrpD